MRFEILGLFLKPSDLVFLDNSKICMSPSFHSSAETLPPTAGSSHPQISAAIGPNTLSFSDRKLLHFMHYQLEKFLLFPKTARQDYRPAFGKLCSSYVLFEGI